MSKSDSLRVSDPTLETWIPDGDIQAYASEAIERAGRLAVEADGVDSELFLLYMRVRSVETALQQYMLLRAKVLQRATWLRRRAARVAKSPRLAHNKRNRS